MGRKIVFTGGSGKAGRHVVPYLKDKGHDVFNLDLGTVLTPLRETIFGLLIVGFLLLEPRGLAQLWKRARQKFSR